MPDKKKVLQKEIENLKDFLRFLDERKTKQNVVWRKNKNDRKS
jgi:hypothetical protein